MLRGPPGWDVRRARGEDAWELPLGLRVRAWVTSWDLPLQKDILEHSATNLVLFPKVGEVT